jgi:hypothetical protein
MKITKSQLKQIIKEEADSLLKESRLYGIEEIISELYQLEKGVGVGLADRLTGWWEMLQNDPAFMELGKDPSDKFSGRRG